MQVVLVLGMLLASLTLSLGSAPLVALLTELLLAALCREPDCRPGDLISHDPSPPGP